MKFVYTEKSSKPAGHYSQAIEHNGLVYISGQLPVDNEGKKEFGTIDKQTKQVLENLDQILKASGSKKENVLKVTVYVSDISLWDDINKVYAEYFGNHKPARVVVPTRDLHYGFKVEMEAVAFVD